MPEKPSRREFLKMLPAVLLVGNAPFTTLGKIRASLEALFRREPGIGEVKVILPRNFKEQEFPWNVRRADIPNPLALVGIYHSPEPGGDLDLVPHLLEILKRFEQGIGDRPAVVMEYFPFFKPDFEKRGYSVIMEEGLGGLTQVRNLMPWLFVGAAFQISSVLSENVKRREILELLGRLSFWPPLQGMSIAFPSVQTWREREMGQKVLEELEERPVFFLSGVGHREPVEKYVTDPLYRQLLDFFYSRIPKELFYKE